MSVDQQFERVSVVAIGGGHGLAMVLRALVDRVGRLTAVVSVADDGGSSGRLRRDFDIVAPGDLRRCLSALAGDDLLAAAFEQRFEQGVFAGHPAGNMMLASLLKLSPNPAEAVAAAAGMLQARGVVLPAADEPVDLVATTERGTVRGQVALRGSGPIGHIRFSPPSPRCSPLVVEAIRDADALVLGPGSLYSSVLAAVTPAVRDAINGRRGRLIYVANLVPEPGETDDLEPDDYLAAIVGHGIEPDLMVVNADDAQADAPTGRIVALKVAEDGGREHDPVRLGEALSKLIS